MPSIADAVTHIVANEKPVLFLDTCILLDVLRASYRKDVRIDTIEAAVRLRQAFQNDEVSIVVGSLIKIEWNDNVDQVQTELEARLASLDEQIKQMRIAANALGLTVAMPQSLTLTPLRSMLLQISADLLSAAIELDQDDAMRLNAMDRVVSQLPPAREKGQVKDCLIIEEYLEICRQLQGAAFTEPLVFCTSNRRDFCESASNPFPNLAAEYGDVGLDFTTDLPWAIAVLGI